MTANASNTRHSPPPAPVRRLMSRHGLPEPQARLVAFLAYGETLHG